MVTLRESKLYYTISEVSEFVGVEQHVLRYWETEFTKLRPKKNRAGNRAYREKDIKLLMLIKRLLYENKYTIDGARQELKKSESLISSQMEIAFEENSKKKLISTIKSELLDIVKILE